MTTGPGVGQRTGPPALDITHLSKSFGSSWALRDVALAVLPGEVHALVGENGSGKSTLIKVLSGYHLPSAGSEIHVAGHPLSFGNPMVSHRLGCRFVHQDLGLIDTLSVADNLSLGVGYPTRLGTIRSGPWRRELLDALELVELEVDLDAPVAMLSPGAKTGVAVARALRVDPHGNATVLVLDEPTATLPAPQVAQLHQIVRAVAARGIGVVYVSHHLEEIFDLADRVTVLRDGASAGTHRPSELDHGGLVKLIVGDVQSPAPSAPAGAVDHRSVLTLTALSRGPLRRLDLDARAGEIVGIAGLTGSGRDTVLSSVFGANPRDGGTVEVDGAELREGDPRRAMALGVAYMPPDRKIKGGVMTMTSRENFGVTGLREFWTFPAIRRKREGEAAARWFRQLDVRPLDAVEKNLGFLSGGNQQKVLLSKWLRRSPKVLLLEEPTQGVDIAAKALLHRQIVSAARAGACVVVSSADNGELAELCDRVIVLRRGTICARLQGAGLTTAALTHATLGQSEELAS